MYWQLYLALLDGFCFDPSVALVTMLQAAKHNFYGCEKPRPGLGVFCSECFWSRPGLSQCESLLVIDCYTPTRNVNWDTHTHFDARSFRTSSVTPPYPCLCPNEAFIRNPYLTNNQGEPHHANAKLSQDSRPTFNEPVRSGSPSPPPPLLPGTWPGQRGLIIQDSHPPIYLFISLTQHLSDEEEINEPHLLPYHKNLRRRIFSYFQFPICFFSVLIYLESC